MSETDANKQLALDYSAAVLAADETWWRGPIASGFRRHDLGLFQFRDGRLIEHWAPLDNPGLLRQLGATTL